MSKIIERDGRLRVHRKNLIDEYVNNEKEQNCKNVKKDTVDMIIATTHHIYSEFAVLDNMEDDMDELKKLLKEQAQQGKSNTKLIVKGFAVSIAFMSTLLTIFNFI